MKIEQINAMLDKMLNEQKSRNFLNHLVRAYIPINKVDKVWENPAEPLKCVLTKIPLTSVNTILLTLQTDEAQNAFIQDLKTFITDEGISVSRSLANVIGQAQLAVTGKDTNTAMSYDTFQTFYSWVLNKSLEGDKHINWLLGSIRREQLVKSEKPKFEKTLRGISVKQTTYNLGETSGALASLKLKLLNEEKSNG